MTFTHQKGNTYKDSIGEKFVSHIWESGHFVKSNLRTKDGRIIEVLHPGQWNNDAGADFTDAVIRIDDKIIKGDVEVHVQNTDWKIHHHDTDSRYNNTILHVVLWDGGTSLLAKKQNNERIPNLILSDYLEVSISKLLKAESNKKNIQCPVNANPEIIDRAGIERLRIKSNAMNEQIASNGEDQALYEGIMDALGYSKNRKQFIDLAQKVPVNTLLGQKLEKIQAILFGTANLLPNIENRDKFDKETVEYLDTISPIWDEVKSQFHDKLITDEWRFFRLRPDNFPTRRMAGISFILSNCESEKSSLTAKFLSILENNDKPIKELSRKLRTILTPKAYGYWTNHYTFGSRKYIQNSLIGNSRADDIVINVILPFTLAYSKRLSNEILSECAMRLWTGYGRLQDNTVTRYFSNRIFQSEKEYYSIINSASRQQGLKHIYKSFCSLHNCNNCPFT